MRDEPYATIFGPSGAMHYRRYPVDHPMGKLQRLKGEPIGAFDRVYQVIAEGQEWEDSDGNTTWSYDEAQSVAQRVRDNGYDPVEVV